MIKPLPLLEGLHLFEVLLAFLTALPLFQFLLHHTTHFARERFCMCKAGLCNVSAGHLVTVASYSLMPSTACSLNFS